VVKQYRKHIAEGKNIIYLSTIVALLLRWGYLTSYAAAPVFTEDSLWVYLAPLFSNKYISFFSAFLFTVMISVYVLHINGKYSLIRRKTYLPYVFSLFLLTCIPGMLYMTPAYIGLIIVLLSTDILFRTYQSEYVAKEAFSIGVLIALAALLIPDMLLYIPVYWIGFYMMRSFNIRVILGSLSGLLMVICMYVSYVFFRFESFEPVIRIFKFEQFREFFTFQVSIIDWIIFSIGIIIFIVVIHSYINKYKDKIRTRANMSFFNLIIFFSLIIYLFFNPLSQIEMVVGLTTSTFVLAHFFALADQKWEVCFFILMVLFYFGTYYYLLVK